MKAKNNGPNWNRIKAEYISGGISQQKLAQKHGVPFGTLQRRARLEEWTELRRQADEESNQKLIQKTADLRIEMTELFEKAGLEAIRAIYENFLRFPNGTGTRITRNLYNAAKSEDGEAEHTRAKSKLVPDTIAEHDMKAGMDMLAAWARIYGMDEASRLAREKLAMEKEDTGETDARPVIIDTRPSGGFLDGRN